MGNLSIPFTNVLSANISALFHLYLPDRKTLDDSHEGWVAWPTRNPPPPYAPRTIALHLHLPSRSSPLSISAPPRSRKQMFWLDTVVFLLQLCALPTLLILPAQKDHVQRLIASGRKNAFMGECADRWFLRCGWSGQRSPGFTRSSPPPPCAAWFVVIGLGFCLVWSVMGNFMQIFPQTACLRLVGGRGCGTAAKA